MLGTDAPPPNSAEWVIAAFTAIGGLGAGVGAVSAWFAASASRDTARDIRRAYAAARRPDLTVSSFGANDGPPWKSGLVLWNQGDVEAVDIDVVGEFVNGTVGRGRLESLPTRHVVDRPYLFVELDPAPSNDELVGASRAFERVTVTFSDRERAGRWERVFNAVVSEPDPAYSVEDQPPEQRNKVARLVSETLLS